jgi:hypothetical protein
MIFPERQLLKYATPVRASELVVGKEYFIAHFVDAEMLIPEVRAIVFIGTDTPENGSDEFVFQDASSFLDGIKPDDATEDQSVHLFTCPASGLSSIYDFDAALDVLLRCALNRTARKSGEP